MKQGYTSDHNFLPFLFAGNTELYPTGHKVAFRNFVFIAYAF